MFKINFYYFREIFAKELAFYSFYEKLEDFSHLDFGNNPFVPNNTEMKERKEIFACTNEFLQQLQVNTYFIIIKGLG